jgi:zinc/manganese transport system permease protein
VRRIGPPQTVLTVVVGIAVALAVLLLARPLLFATIEAGAAAADGVPVHALGTAFHVLVAVITAGAVQVVGALLILGLIATPAAIAQRLTARPYRAMVTSAVVAILAVWVGLGLSYAVPVVPPSFAVIGLLFGTYVALVAAPRLRRLRPEMHA